MTKVTLFCEGRMLGCCGEGDSGSAMSEGRVLWRM